MELLRRLAGNFTANLHLVTAIAFFWLVDSLAQRRLRAQGWGHNHIANLTYWLGGGALIGARIIYLLPTFPVLYRHPFDTIQINAGLSFYGALAAGMLAALIYGRRRAVPFFAITDAYALYLPLGIALFRLSCFLHGPCWGKATDSFLGIRFSGLTIPRYPSDLYEGFLTLALLGLLLSLYARHPRPGLLSAAFLLGYAVIRGLTDLTRIQLGFWPAADPWLALAMGIAGIGFLLVAKVYNKPPIGATSSLDTDRTSDSRLVS